MLVPDVRRHLERMLSSGPIVLYGSIRPGCLHLLVDVLMVCLGEACRLSFGCKTRGAWKHVVDLCDPGPPPGHCRAAKQRRPSARQTG